MSIQSLQRCGDVRIHPLYRRLVICTNPAHGSDSGHVYEALSAGLPAALGITQETTHG